MKDHSILNYSPVNGYIHNWLVAGPTAVPVTNLDQFPGPDFKLLIARHYFQPESGVTRPVAEQLPFESHESGLNWRTVHCQDDHFVDLSAFYFTTHYLCAWAYAQVVTDTLFQGTWVLTTNGPADVWVNGIHIHRQEHFHHVIPHRVSFEASLLKGKNEILVRMEEVAARECPYTMALQIMGLPGTARIHIPTTIEPLEHRQRLEEVFESAYLDRDIYGPDDFITVRWATGWNGRMLIVVRLQSLVATDQAGARVYAEVQPDIAAGDHCDITQGHRIPPGRYLVRLMSLPGEKNEPPIHMQRDMPLEITHQTFSSAPIGSYEQRRHESLQHAAAIQINVFSETAKMES